MANRRPITVVDSLTSFLEQVAHFSGKWLLRDEEVVGPWFRGQHNAEWPLVPKLYRQYGNDRYIEDEIREEFAQRGPTFCENVPNNDWDWYFLMQHYGAPTRLLDWTDGALIGLYFALRESCGLTDAAVWMLDPFWLNKRVLGRDEIISPSASGVLKEDRNILRRWLPARFKKNTRLPKNPAAVFPGHIAQRISTQRSCFTVHGSAPRALDVFAGMPGDRLVKLVIPSFEVPKLRKELETCGIDEATVFPDLGGLSRALADRWRNNDDALPHDGVYTRLRRSKISGIGVFAIRRIPKGARLFVGDSDEMRWVATSDVRRVPKEIGKLYEDFAILRDGRYGCPSNFNGLTMSWYLNESPDPNVRCDAYYNFSATRDIKEGEELTTNYSTYSEAPTVTASKNHPPKSRSRKYSN